MSDCENTPFICAILAIRDLCVGGGQKQVFKVYLRSPTNISEFVPYNIYLSYNKNRIDPNFVCSAVQHLANVLDCVILNLACPQETPGVKLAPRGIVDP
jgi:dihydroorotate dehydrogenase